MLANKLRYLTAVPVILPLLCGSCGVPDDSGGIPETDRPADEAPIADGEEVAIRRQDGFTTFGIQVSIRKRDGTKVPAVFRGPTKLADVLSGGTFEFDEDSLPARVRPAEPGEEVLRRVRDQP